jgi:hypothetical protein
VIKIELLFWMHWFHIFIITNRNEMNEETIDYSLLLVVLGRFTMKDTLEKHKRIILLHPFLFLFDFHLKRKWIRSLSILCVWNLFYYKLRITSLFTLAEKIHPESWNLINIRSLDKRSVEIILKSIINWSSHMWMDISFRDAVIVS